MQRQTAEMFVRFTDGTGRTLHAVENTPLNRRTLDRMAAHLLAKPNVRSIAVNGFANPLFDHDTALRAAEMIKSVEQEWIVTIRDEDDGVHLLFEADDGSQEYTESFNKIDGLYSAGYGWCWVSKRQHPGDFPEARLLDLDAPCAGCSHTLIAHVPNDSGEKSPCAECGCRNFRENPS